MIPNMISTLVGILLCYVVILSPGSMDLYRWLLPSSAILLFVMAIWARQSDYLRWHSSTNMILGAVLLVISLLRPHISSQFTFWMVLWVGILEAVFALWAALHRPPVSAST